MPWGPGQVFVRWLGGLKRHSNHKVANSATQVGRFIKWDGGKQPEGPARSLPDASVGRECHQITKWPIPRHRLVDLSNEMEANALRARPGLFQMPRWAKKAIKSQSGQLRDTGWPIYQMWQRQTAWEPSLVFARCLSGPRMPSNHKVGNSTTQVGPFIKLDRGKRPEGLARSLSDASVGLKGTQITKWPTPRHRLANLSKVTEANSLKAWPGLCQMPRWAKNALKSQSGELHDIGWSIYQKWWRQMPWGPGQVFARCSGGQRMSSNHKKPTPRHRLVDLSNEMEANALRARPGLCQMPRWAKKALKSQSG